LQAADISTDDLRLDYIHLRVDNEQNGNKFLDICYEKSYKTYQYYSINNVVSISIDPVDGSLISFDNPGEIPAPLTVKLIINKDQAITTATKYLVDNKITYEIVSAAALYIVLPNNTW
jgi:hypothetical protein